MAETPPLPITLTDQKKTPTRIIADDAGISTVAAQIAAVENVVLDTEADSLHHYFEKICLIQIAIGDEVFIVDPLGADPSPIIAALAQKRLLFHGADYDLRLLAAAYAFHPQGEVFDTMLAAKLLGREQIGLAALLFTHFGITLDKGGQKSDWSRRPLLEKQLRYAAADVSHLSPLAHLLAEELNQMGRIEWHRESCQAMVAAAVKSEAQEKEDPWRIKGTGTLSSRELAFLRSLWYWRDGEARAVDLPPFMILINEQMLRLATLAARAQGVIMAEELIRLPRNCTGQRFTSLQDALVQATSLPPSEYPKKKRREFSTRADPALLDALMNALRKIAADLSLDPSIVASRSSVAACASEKPSTREEMIDRCSLLCWQADLLWPDFEKILRQGW